MRTGLWRAAAVPALAVMIVLLATAGRYDLHGDELYFRMLPTAWWYDDQPPLVVWLSRSAAAISDAVWVQRIPAVLAAGAGTVMAALYPRLLGYGIGVQRVAAWAHAFTVYPLLVGHVFLTASLDLVAWQAVIFLVTAAVRRRRGALWATGVVAGLACWNKLLILVLVLALTVGLIVGDRGLLRTREAFLAGLSIVVLGGPQLAAQLLHGMPMSQVATDLAARQGDLNRLLVLPLLIAFAGPPFVPVWWRGLQLRLRPDGPARLLPVTLLVLVVWTVAVPSQPYYPVAALLPAMALGWGAACRDRAPVWRRARLVVAVNAAVSVVLCLPILPADSPVTGVIARVNPVVRDQLGWPAYVEQIARVPGATGPATTIVTDSYALAGAVSHHGPAQGLTRVASGHNALWDMGPPATREALLVGPIAVTHRHLFRRCVDAGVLTVPDRDPFRIAGSAMARCDSPVGGWSAVWPAFRRLGA